jgi:glycosyltransferase involved in cell wall biosynthesis
MTRCFVTNSTAGASYLSTALGIAAQRIRHIPNGVDLPAAQADRRTWRGRLRLQENQFAACMVANLTDYKDHPTLIRAWRLVVDRWSMTEGRPVLLLAGRWDGYANVLRTLANQLGLYDEVRLLGPIDDVAGLLGSVDLGVFSSEREGCPNGVLECMAAGLPVVATDIPGTRDALGPGGHEFLVPMGNGCAMAEAILRLADDAALRQAAGEANRGRILAGFTPELMGSAYQELIQQQLANRAV